MLNANLQKFKVQKPQKIGLERSNLLSVYESSGIISCEGVRLNGKCSPYFALSIHHLDRRSSGQAVDSFEKTRLLCPDCHLRADTDKTFNDQLRKAR